MIGSPDVAIVGAGVGGGAIGHGLARAGLSVAILERTDRHVDRVRGEWLAPWGVAEAKTLGLADALVHAGGNFLTRSVGYDETIDTATAEATAIDCRQLHPVGTGPMSISHPTICDTFDRMAVAAGATLLRNVEEVVVHTGSRPRIRFVHAGMPHDWSPKLVIAADGRTSTVRRQLGMTLARDEPHHFIGGMLVDGVPDWPREQQSVGTEGNLNYLVFPQGQSRVRLYACYGAENRERFTGPGREQHLLEAFRLPCLPLGDAIASGTPIGPFHSVPNEDRWLDGPIADGVVLIGDAAGFSDPTIGQGLSITLRDVRLLTEMIADGAERPDHFRPYADDRRERMRRLRIAGRFWSILHAEFGPDAAARRARALRRAFGEGQLSPIMAIFAGPETLPPEAFQTDTMDALLAA
jgi:2-polyprenyl-6-methoxyphenol hydroxylase-like FAD-dependent oxidoreductase